MDSSLVKRSVRIQGHPVDISIEDMFWDSLEEIARDQATTTSRLVASIEAERGQASLPSAIRVYVIDHFLTKAESLEVLDEDWDDDEVMPAACVGFLTPRPRWLN